MFIVKIELDHCGFTWLQIQSNVTGDRDHVWCYDNPQGHSVDSQKITIYADIPDTKEHDKDFLFK